MVYSALILLPIGVGCSNVQSYKNQTIGIEIEYPNSWILSETSESDISIRPLRSSSTSIIIQLQSKKNVQQSASKFLQEILQKNVQNQTFTFREPVQVKLVDDFEAASVLGIQEIVTLTGREYEVPINIMAVDYHDNILLFFISDPNQETEGILDSISLAP